MSPTLVGILSVGVAVTLLCCTSTKASNETMNTDVSPSGSQEVVCLKSDLEDLRKIADGIKSSYEATESTHQKVVKDMADRMSGIQDQLRTMQLEMSVLTVRSDLDVLRSGLSRLDTEMKEKVSTVSIASSDECPENQTNHQLAESEPAWKPAVEDLTASLEQLSERFTSLEVKNTETEKEWAPAVENLTVSLGALSERINSLEAKTAALGKENADLKMQLTAKRYESGSQVFQPHDQPTARGGSRTHTKHVTFSSPFASVPVVFSALYHLDVYSGANLRIHTAVSNIDKDGFDLAVNEWASSHTYGASVRWMACSN